MVGYTNAGKSTLMEKISEQKMYIKDELFATLDTNTRKVNLNKYQSFIISDTVGFIRNLPDNLIASFRSTLSELIDSDLLLKVIDVSSLEYEEHLNSIENVLNHLSISDKKYIIIFNKTDLLQDKSLIKKVTKLYPSSSTISTNMDKNTIKKTIKLPYSKLNLINKLYTEFEVLSRTDQEDMVEFKISGDKNKINKIISKIKK